MTPAEIVACVERMMWQVLTCQNRIRASHDWYGTRTGDDALNETATFARAAFHEAGRLLDFCEGSRVWCECGDQVTSEGWPHGDPVLCWVCTAEHKRRIAEAEAPQTCGTCADWHQRPRYGNGGICRNPNSACYADRVNADDGGIWPATHGCPAWRRKDGAA